MFPPPFCRGRRDDEWSRRRRGGGRVRVSRALAGARLHFLLAQRRLSKVALALDGALGIPGPLPKNCCCCCCHFFFFFHIHEPGQNANFFNDLSRGLGLKARTSYKVMAKPCLVPNQNPLSFPRILNISLCRILFFAGIEGRHESHIRG